MSDWQKYRIPTTTIDGPFVPPGGDVEVRLLCRAAVHDGDVRGLVVEDFGVTTGPQSTRLDPHVESHAVDPFAVIEDRLHAELSHASRLAATSDRMIGQECGALAEAIQRVRALGHADRVAAQQLDPGVVGRAAWHASQEAGCSTKQGDDISAAVAAAVMTMQRTASG